MGYNKLTNEEKQIILHKGTEQAFSGKYDKFYEDGIYECKQCGSKLFNSTSKFNSKSGWPSFDDCIGNNVKEILDTDGNRIEIICNNCNGHLGHVFKGEGYTNKMTRHCVNSVSLNFLKQMQ